MITDYSLYFVADADFAAGRDLLPLIEAAVRGGATVVQLRAKNRSFNDFVDLGRQAAAVLKRLGVPLLINDRVDVALACRAEGVHLGQEDVPPAMARRALAEGTVIGVSAKTPDEAREAERQGADYIGAGPVFVTASKAIDLPVIGPDGVRRIKAAIRVPVVAIGGITEGNAGELRAAGADGIAVISAILGAADPEAAARRLKSSFLGAGPLRRES